MGLTNLMELFNEEVSKSREDGFTKEDILNSPCVFILGDDLDAKIEPSPENVAKAIFWWNLYDESVVGLWIPDKDDMKEEKNWKSEHLVLTAMFGHIQSQCEDEWSKSVKEHLQALRNEYEDKKFKKLFIYQKATKDVKYVGDSIGLYTE